MVIGNSYNFTTISSVILNGVYKNLKLVGDIGFKQAVKYSGVYNDVVTIRQRLVLETGVTLLPSDVVRYFLFEDTNGDEILIAEDWIITNTITTVSSVSGVFTVSNITSADITIINNMISALGYNSLDTKIINT